MKNSEISSQQESAKYPIILKGTWWVWNADSQQYENSGVSAIGDKGEQGEICPLKVLKAKESKVNNNRAQGPKVDTGGNWLSRPPRTKYYYSRNNIFDDSRRTACGTFAIILSASTLGIL